MIIKVPKKITLKGLADWMKTYTKCEVRVNGSRLNIVVKADNVDPGRCIPLFAILNGGQIMICELSGEYYSLAAAWQALEDKNSDHYLPIPFHDWVQDQYLTAEDVKVEKLSF